MRSSENSSIFKAVDLTEGSIAGGMIAFVIPLFIGQLLQQLYNLADAWVIGNFAANEAFAAVSTSGNIVFLIIGFCNGLSIGGSVIISRYFGAKDAQKTSEAIHTNLLMGIGASVLGTLVGIFLIPIMVGWMNVPDSVLPYALTYLKIYFSGVSTVILYNIFMSIMRALGDSIHPLLYLLISSVVNIILDLLFVAVFGWGVSGAAIATVCSQGLSALLCLIRMMRASDMSRIELRKIRFYPAIMKAALAQGLPTGVQNSVISIGNIVVQANINAFGAAAMSGQGAYAKIEGFVFLPIMCISSMLPTFISQNLGARKPERAKRGAFYGIAAGMVLAEAFGIFFRTFGRELLGIFISDESSIGFGLTHIRCIVIFYFLLAFSHCAAGTLRGLGKSIIPMFAMLSVWCAFRILYVTLALKVFPVYETICFAYPITWTITTIIFGLFLLRMDWEKA